MGVFQNEFGEFKNVECGLVSIVSDGDNAPVPLESVDIVANVIHAVAHVELTQVFVNKEKQPIEAIYFFPLDSNAGVTQFRAKLDGRTITGVVKPEAEAKKQYKNAVKNNQTAIIVESNKPDIFQVKIGMLKPEAKVKVVISYATEVKNEKGSYAQRFFIPTTVAPRYFSATNTDEKAEDLKKMPFSENSPAPMSITVNVMVDGGLKSIQSPTHAINVEGIEAQHAGRATVTLKGTTTDMDRDFVLLISPIEVHAPRLYIEENADSTAVMTHLIPSFKLHDQKVELIFVLDCSGSMGGASIQMAKKALSLFLHSAPADCYFNIVGFGSSYKLLFPTSVKYDDQSLKTAIAHAKSLEADLGGTELYSPLKAIFEKPAVAGYLRQIFVLTDGEIFDTEAVLGLIKANAHLGRVFSMGIGAACSHHLVEGLAEAGNGTANFVTYAESIDAKILQQLKNSMQPSLSNVQVEWMGIPLPEPEPVGVQTRSKSTKLSEAEAAQEVKQQFKFNQVPEKVPPIYDGSQLLVFGLFENILPSGAKITAESPDGPLSVEMKFDAGRKLNSKDTLHKLAAVKLVRELELKISAMKRKSKAFGDKLKKEVVDISCQHGISSSYTAFIAVDSESQEPTDDNWVMQKRHVPSQVAYGWGGGGYSGAPMQGGYGYGYFAARSTCPATGRAPMQGGGYAAARRTCPATGGVRNVARRGGPRVTIPRKRLATNAARKSTPMATGNFAAGRSVCSKRSGSSVSGDGGSIPKRGCGASTSSNPTGSASISKTDDDQKRMHTLVGTQSSNGSFALTDAFANAIGQKLQDIQNETKKLGYDEVAFATALALEYFAKKLDDLKTSWELVALKAKKWLAKNYSKSHVAIQNAAEKFLD